MFCRLKTVWSIDHQIKGQYFVQLRLIGQRETGILCKRPTAKPTSRFLISQFTLSIMNADLGENRKYRKSNHRLFEFKVQFKTERLDSVFDRVMVFIAKKNKIRGSVY